MNRRRRLTLSAGLWAALELGGCRRPAEAPAIRIDREIAPSPARVGPATVTLKLSGADGRAVTGAHVILEGDMAHPGMSPEFADARETGGGRYEGRLDFTMAGDWIMLVHVTLPGGVTLERQLDVKGVRAN